MNIKIEYRNIGNTLGIWGINRVIRKLQEAVEAKVAVQLTLDNCKTALAYIKALEKEYSNKLPKDVVHLYPEDKPDSSGYHLCLVEHKDKFFNMLLIWDNTKRIFEKAEDLNVLAYVDLFTTPLREMYDIIKVDNGESN